MGKMSVFGLVAFFWCFILVLGDEDNGLLLRADVYRTTCPNHAPSVEEYLLQDVPVKTKIQCVALCQRNESCSAVTFADGLCSLMTSGEEGCEQRESGQGGLERVTSSWCSHGGEHVSEEECNCPEEYDGKFCTKAAAIVAEPVTELILTAHMPGMVPDGQWECLDRCPPGSFAAGMELQIESIQGTGDDTAVNVIRLLCVEASGAFLQVGDITSGTTLWGNTMGKMFCQPDFWIVGFRLNYQPAGGGGDETGVNGLEVVCRGPGVDGTVESSHQQQMGQFDTLWSGRSPKCQPGSSVCGLRTKILPDQDSGDDMGVVDAAMQCCDMINVANTTQDGELELSVEMPDMYQQGEWDTCPDRCPNGSYAAGMQLEIEPDGQDDDTAVNVIRLLCRDAALDEWVGSITSFAKGWGEPREEFHCPSDYWIVQFRLQYEPDQGAGDNSAVNGVAAVCSGPGPEGSDESISFRQFNSGIVAEFLFKWSPWSEVCPPGSAVCGLATKVQEWQGNDGDDVAVADARMTCCPFPPL